MVALAGSRVAEGPGVQSCALAILSNASEGVTTITTDRGVIHIADGETVGTLTLGSNGEDVYLDASNLTATITAVAGGNFENHRRSSGLTTAHIDDTITVVTVTLTSSTVAE